MSASEFIEKKIVFLEGENVRVLRGKITKIDGTFYLIKRRDGNITLNKKYIIKIEEGNNGRK
ncbi:MAG TPA: hypothetical protein VKP59_05185 [Candidatus Thermoplasmatota archaeon]|nr:hypothetical protein [Candidatus Thermoplasmatota archaeon]